MAEGRRQGAEKFLSGKVGHTDCVLIQWLELRKKKLTFIVENYNFIIFMIIYG
jgi:hypothetical protein